MKPRIYQLALGISLLSGSSFAQKTWIVDAARGSGYDFDDLPAAVAAAKDGDTVIVRAGKYQPATISKGLRLLGRGAVINTAVSNGLVPLKISNVAARSRCVLKGFRFIQYGLGASPSGRALVEITNNSGPVHVEDCHIDTQRFGYIHADRSLQISGSRSVSLTRVTCTQTSVISSSSVAAHATILRGLSAMNSGFPNSYLLRRSTKALVLTGGSMIFDACTVSGGGGTRYKDRVSQRFMFAPGSMAVQASAADIVAAGGSSFSHGDGKAAIQAAGGNLLYDPNVTLSHSGFAIVHRTPLSTQRASPGKIGSAITAELRSVKGTTALLMLGQSAPAISLPELGQVWIDLASLWIVDAGPVDANGLRKVSIAVPNDRRLRGLALALQSLTLRGRALGISSPAIVVLDD